MNKSLILIQKLNAKILHDLAGSVSVINNSLDLVASDNNLIKNQTELLLNQESLNLVNKIKIFRMAYGLSDHESSMRVDYVAELLKNFIKKDNVNLILNFSPDIIELDTQIIKIFICLILIVFEQSRSGGDIKFYIGNNNMAELHITDKIAYNMMNQKNHFEILNGNIDISVNIKNCREHYINEICDYAGYKLSIDQSSSLIKYQYIG